MSASAPVFDQDPVVARVIRPCAGTVVLGQPSAFWPPREIVTMSGVV